jgi:excisionase family DNA binding protein
LFEFNIQTANVHNIPIVLTVQDMAEILRVKEVVIEELVRDGKIKAVKDITEIRVPSISFLNFLSDQTMEYPEQKMRELEEGNLE